METKCKTLSWSQKCSVISELEGTYRSSHFMTEETETQRGNSALSGRAEDRAGTRPTEAAYRRPCRQEDRHAPEPGRCGLPSLTMLEKREETGVRAAAWVTPILFSSPLAVPPQDVRILQVLSIYLTG